MAASNKLSVARLAYSADAIKTLVLFIALVVVVVGGFVIIRGGEIGLFGLTLASSDFELPLWLLIFVALGWSLGSVTLLFAFVQSSMSLVPPKLAGVLTPFLLVAPMVVLISWTLLIPLARTVITSLQTGGELGSASEFVLFDNYVRVFTESDGLTIFRNTALWIVVGTPVALTFGMIIAVLADGRRGERWIKSVIFAPLAISLVGAGVIWGLIYQIQPAESPQTGLLNAVVVGLGGEPQGWLLSLQPWNNLFLMAVAIWSGTGFSMVFFSAALRGVPSELIEAARVDGAGELRIFFRIRLPYIWPTVLAVATTSVIFNLKIFDVVQTQTGGGFGTEVIATAFFRAEYEALDSGLASAFAIILLILVIPVIIYNLRQFRSNEGLSPGRPSILGRMVQKFTGRRKAA